MYVCTYICNVYVYANIYKNIYIYIALRIWAVVSFSLYYNILQNLTSIQVKDRILGTINYVPDFILEQKF